MSSRRRPHQELNRIRSLSLLQFLPLEALRSSSHLNSPIVDDFDCCKRKIEAISCSIDQLLKIAIVKLQHTFLLEYMSSSSSFTVDILIVAPWMLLGVSASTSFFSVSPCSSSGLPKALPGFIAIGATKQTTQEASMPMRSATFTSRLLLWLGVIWNSPRATVQTKRWRDPFLLFRKRRRKNLFAAVGQGHGEYI